MNQVMLWVISAVLLFAGAAYPVLSEEDWRVVAYDNDEIFVIRPYAVEVIQLPETAQNREPPGNINLKLSADERYVVYTTREKDGRALGAFILDLQTESLRKVEQSIQWRSDEPAGGEIAMVGPFSPDGQQVTISMADWYGGILQIIDVASGEVLVEAETSQLIAEPHRNYALLPEWSEDGLLLYPHCFPCEGFVEGFAYRWQPNDNSITRTNIPYRVVTYRLMSDRLASSGEVLVAGQDFSDRSQASPVTDVNIITYFDRDFMPDSSTGMVVYTDPAELSLLLTSHWVAGGRGYLVHSQTRSESTLVLRDTSLHSVDDAARTFVSGTADGWIMHDDFHFYHYTVTQTGDIAVVQLPFTGDKPALFDFVFISETPTLGNGAHDPPQPVIAIH